MFRRTTAILILSLTSIAALSQTYTLKTSSIYDGYQLNNFYSPGISFSSPAAGDWDGDGDVDLIVGNAGNSLIYYRNDDINTNIGGSDSTMDAPVLTLGTRNLVSIDGEARLSPAFAGQIINGTMVSIDGDDLPDLLVGTLYGHLYYYKNTGQLQNGIPVFDPPEEITLSVPGYYLSPRVIDADGDGLLDLFVGNQRGAIQYYTPDSSVSGGTPSFTLVNPDITSTEGTLQYACPDFCDIDGNGSLDLLISRGNGSVLYFSKIDSSPSYSKVSSAFDSLNLENSAKISFADLNNDSKPDLLSGNSSGNIQLLLNDGNIPAHFILKTRYFASFDLGSSSAPLIVDVNGDGKSDLLVANSKTIAYFKNIATAGPKTAPVWKLVSTTYLSSNSLTMKLAAWDYDNDGDIDLFFTSREQGVGFFKNVGTKTNPSFQLVNGGNPFSGDSFQNIKLPYSNNSLSFCDLDGDGDQDLIIAGYKGTTSYYRNDDVNINQGGSDDRLDGQPDFVQVYEGNLYSNSLVKESISPYATIAATDIDRDGDFDILVTPKTGVTTLFRNNGDANTPNFVNEGPFENLVYNPNDKVAAYASITVGDVNQDGWPDIMIGGEDGGLVLWTNNKAIDTANPTAPSNPAGNAKSDSSIELTWGPAYDNVGGASNNTGIAKYVIYRDGTKIAELPLPHPMNYYDEWLPFPTHSYSYEIYAVDRAGLESPHVSFTASTGAAATLDHFRLTVPTELQDADFSITVEAIDNYGNLYSSFSNTVNLTLPTGSTGSISPTSVDLIKGKATVSLTYTDAGASDEVILTITADDGTVPPTTSDEVHLDIIPPVKPNFLATPSGPYAINLSWAPVSDAGGSQATTLNIYRDGSFLKNVSTTPGLPGEYLDENLTPATTYTYYAVAKDSVGNLSIQSDPTEATTPETSVDSVAPSIPENFNLVSKDTTSIAFQWSPSTDTGGSGLKGYLVYRGPDLVGEPVDPRFTDTGLTPGTEYAYSVRAIDNAGNTSDYSSPAFLVTTNLEDTGDTTLPTTPTGLSGSVTSDTSVHISWNASSDAGGSGLAGYQVFRSDYGSYTTVLAFISAPTQTFDNSGLTPGTQYRYRLKAIDGAGNTSGYSNEVTLTTTNSAVDTEPPSVPTSLTGSAQSAQDILLQWAASTDNKGVAEYEVYQNVANGMFGDNHYLLKTVASPATNTHITEDHDGNSLAPATEYRFSIIAVDTSDNKSDYSAVASVTTPDVANDTTPPFPPANLHFTEVRSFHIMLAFDAAQDNQGGSGVKQYHIYKNGTLAATISTTTYEDTDVVGGQSYGYYVIAEDYADNPSDPTDTITTTVPMEDLVAPTTPSGLAYTATSSEVTLSWNMSVDDGSGVDYYEINRTDSSTKFKTKGAITVTTPFTSWTDDTVIAGTSYQYKVRALDRAGNASSFSLLTVDVPEETAVDNTIYFPHLDSSNMWWTGFALVNTSGTAAKIGFEFYSADGGEPVATLPDYTTLDAGQKLVYTIHDLFDDGNPETENDVPANAAWWRVTSDQPLNGFELFGTTDAEEMVGVKISKTASNRLLFPSIKVNDNYWTGITLVNTGDTGGTVTFHAYDADGNELAGAPTRPIASHGKLVDVVQNFFDDQTLPAGTAVVEVVSDQPCIGFELFGTHGNEALGIKRGLAGLSALPLDADTAFQKALTTKSLKTTNIKAGDAPNNLSATVLNASSVELDWEVPDTGAPDSYQIWTAAVTSTPFYNEVELETLIGETADTSYIAGGLTANTEYTFVVVGITDGNQSDASDSVTVTTPAESVPEAYTYMAPRLEEHNGGKTELHMANLANEAASITVATIDDEGNTVESTPLTIAAQGSTSLIIADTFTIDTDIVAARVVSDKKLATYEVFDNQESGYYDTLYLFSKGMNKIYFTHIAPETNYWNSYIAMWNLSEYSNLVELRLHKPDGSLLSTVSTVIPAGGVSSGEIHDYVPDDDTVQQIGWIEVAGQYPINGYLAFGPKDGKTLAAIEAE